MRRAHKWWIAAAAVAIAAASFLAAVAAYVVYELVSAQQRLEQGYVAVQNSDWDNAIAHFSAGLRAYFLDKTRASYAYANRGFCHSQQGRRNEALRDYDQALRLNPKIAQVYENRGALHDAAGEKEKALADYSHAIALDPNAAESLFRRGLIWRAQDRLDDAITDLKEAIRARPDTAPFHVSLGEVYLAKKDFPAAIANFDAALSIDDRNIAALQRRAEAHELQGNWQKARADRMRADMLSRLGQTNLGENTQADLYAQGQAALDAGNYDIAIERFSELLGTKLTKEAAVATYISRGNAHLARRALEEARRDYRRALEEDERSTGAYINLAACDLRTGDYRSAIAHCERAIALDPGVGEAYSVRAEALYRSGEAARAIVDLKRALELNAQRPEHAFNQLAWLQATYPDAAVRNGREAVESATRACELTRWENAGVIDTLAAAYAENGQFEKAVQTQERALALPELSPEIRAEMEARLAQYRKGEPYRETPK